MSKKKIAAIPEPISYGKKKEILHPLMEKHLTAIQMNVDDIVNMYFEDHPESNFQSASGLAAATDKIMGQLKRTVRKYYEYNE